MANKRGGARPGAGRPQMNIKKIPLTVRFSVDVAKQLKQSANTNKTSISELVESAVVNHFDK